MLKEIANAQNRSRYQCYRPQRGYCHNGRVKRCKLGRSNISPLMPDPTIYRTEYLLHVGMYVGYVLGIHLFTISLNTTTTNRHHRRIWETATATGQSLILTEIRRRVFSALYKNTDAPCIWILLLYLDSSRLRGKGSALETNFLIPLELLCWNMSLFIEQQTINIFTKKK